MDDYPNLTMCNTILLIYNIEIGISTRILEKQTISSRKIWYEGLIVSIFSREGLFRMECRHYFTCTVCILIEKSTLVNQNCPYYALY